MNKQTIIALAACACLSGITTLYAQESPAPKASKDTAAQAPKKSKKGKKKAPETVVGKALKTINFINDTKPNTKAEFYIYLQSAAWCGPCNQEMPDVAKQYAAMKATGKVEIIFTSADMKPQEALDFMAKYNVSMPCILSWKEVDRKYVASDEAAKLPGFTYSKPVPHATLVDASGKVIKDAHAFHVIPQWRELTGIKEDKPAAK